jgi:hypothetical protein
VANFAAVTLYGGCVRETFGSAGFSLFSGLRTRTWLPPFWFAAERWIHNPLKSSTIMTTNNPPRRFTPMSQFATHYPVLLIDSDAPLRELHNCVSERLNAVLQYLHLMACTSLPDYAENDINTVTNIARIMIQDVSDVFRVIEQRGFEVPKGQ